MQRASMTLKSFYFSLSQVRSGLGKKRRAEGCRRTIKKVRYRKTNESGLKMHVPKIRKIQAAVKQSQKSERRPTAGTGFWFAEPFSATDSHESRVNIWATHSRETGREASRRKPKKEPRRKSIACYQRTKKKRKKGGDCPSFLDARFLRKAEPRNSSTRAATTDAILILEVSVSFFSGSWLWLFLLNKPTFDKDVTGCDAEGTPTQLRPIEQSLYEPSLGELALRKPEQKKRTRD